MSKIKKMCKSMKMRRSNPRITIANVFGTVMFLEADVYKTDLIWPVFDYQTSSELRLTFARINFGLALGSVLFWLLSEVGELKQIPTRT